MTLIEKDRVYGDYRAVDRISERRDLFRAECVRCGRSRRMFRSEVLAEERCGCHNHPPMPVETRKRDPLSLDAIADHLADSTGEPEEEEASTFAEQQREIRELIDLLDGEDLDSDRKFQLVSLKTTVDLIPIAEREFRKYPKQSNALMLDALMRGARDLYLDLQVTEDRTEQAVKIINKILQPFLIQITQVLIDNIFALQRTVEGAVPKEKAERIVNSFGDTLKEISTSYQALFLDTNKQIMAEFQ